jgi:hypothetical protein
MGWSRKGCWIRIFETPEVAVPVPHMEMSRVRSIVLAALTAQEQERTTGFESANPSLDMLRNQLELTELLHLVRELRSASLEERELAARLLAHTRLPGATIVEEVRLVVRDESDPQVIRWLVSALQYARHEICLVLLRGLASHPDARVRFGQRVL